MANWCDNRMEISFVNGNEESMWKAKYLSEDHGRKWLDTTFDPNDPTDPLVEIQQTFAKVVDEEVGDDGSLVLYFESRWAAPSCWFSEMAKSNPSITTASLEFSEPNMLFVGSIDWCKSTNTITETFRSGPDLTDDDWFILGHDRCLKCNQFGCEC